MWALRIPAGGLRQRVALLAAGVMLTVLAATAALLMSLFSAGLREGTDRLLEEDAEILRTMLVVDHAGRLELFGLGADPAGDDPALRRLRYQVRDPDGPVLLYSASPGATPLPLPADRQVAGLYDARFGSEGVRIRLQPMQIGDRPLLLQTVRSIQPFLQQEQRLRTLLWALLPLPVLLVGLLSLAMANVALRPLRDMTQRMQAIGPDNLGERLAVPADIETAGLAGAFNTLLARLDRAFHALRRFTADASHELRTPLTALRMRGEVALHQPRDPDTYRRTIGGMLEEAGRLEHLTDALLKLARGDAGMIRLQPADLALHRYLDEWVERYRPLAADRQVALETRFAVAMTVRADPAILDSVVANLLDNAIRFTPAHGRVQVALERDAGEAVVRVCDSGPGIPPGDRERIFDRFVQLDHARSGRRGFGLGLAITRWAVELHGGTVSAGKFMTQGTCMTVRLPIMQS